ncbi:hypothetical protein [Streptomyces sp. NPDC057877]|uniref:hypothetical protein n=1 Tax=Streptomyces sp. NPDC057877 TaxID=3346269 RepID=UPI0036983230
MAAGISLFATACTGQQEPPARQDDNAQATGSSFAHAPKTFPLDKFKTDSKERQTVDLAISILVNRCMAKYDQSWPEYKPTPGIPDNARKYGVTDLESVRVYGYKPPLPDGVSKAEAIAFRREYDAKEKSITAAARSVYSGPEEEGNGKGDGKGGEKGEEKGGENVVLPPGLPEGGCSGEARRKAEADRLNEDMMTVQDLFWKASATTGKDPRVTELNRRWSDCMKKSGMSYADPLAAVDDRTWRTQKTSGESPTPFFPAPSKAEIRAAEADVKCKEKTGYIETRSAVEFGHQRDIIKEHKAVLDAAWERKQRILKKLSAVVAEEIERP